MVERIGQSVIIAPCEHEPAHQSGNAEQHGKSVVIDKSGLQTDRASGEIQHTCGDTVGAETVNHRAVATFPEQARQPFYRTHKMKLKYFVNVPFVKQELVNQIVFGRELAGNVGRRIYITQAKVNPASIITKATASPIWELHADRAIHYFPRR
ncbi:MAG: hypothetical protein CM15mP21_3050 [Hyphomicrobiales bacterium]|nr:MAG: hypothetical protein CM15mP21_3050 [Hyphomicrobiales bacterium]